MADLALEARLDIARGDSMVQHAILASLIQIAGFYAEHAFDDRLVGAMNDVAERTRMAIAAVKGLREAHRSAEAAGAAAKEFRAQRDGR